ncbi:hypothetical protein WJ49_22805 [Burkholderia ubonensis]|nr:hypothetical protein WJ49_22805 [Burkholderia ubonensis]KVL73207.1 hypothetical protein WJ48_00500 [Burkholderia ubonensis]
MPVLLGRARAHEAAVRQLMLRLVKEAPCCERVRRVERIGMRRTENFRQRVNRLYPFAGSI